MSPARARAALALLAAVQFVLVLDASIVNVALPAIGRGLAVGPDDLSWVVNAYILVFGGLLLLGGRLTDLLGARRVFVAGLGVFAGASLAGGLAQAAGVLVAARAGQGLGAALVSPAALSLLISLFGEGDGRNRALGVWAALGGAGGAAGAILGGVLTDGLGWRSVLFVNVPLAVAAIALAPRLLPGAPSTAIRDRFDVGGATAVTGGLLLVVFGIVGAHERGWGAATTVASIGAGLLLLGAFVVIETRAAAALVPLSAFANRSMRAGNLVTLLNTGALFPMFFLVTLYTQDVLGYGPLESGLAQLPLAASIAASAALAPRVVPALGVRMTLVGGFTALAAGLWWLSTAPVDGSFVTHLLLPSLVIGIGEGLVWVGSMIGATAGIAPEQAGLASGLVNTSQQLGGALGLAVVVAVASASGADARTPAGLSDGIAAGLLLVAGVAAAGALVSARVFAPRPDRVGPGDLARRPATAPAAGSRP